MDPFEKKVQDFDVHTKDQIDSFLDNAYQTTLLKCEVSLTYLVVRTNVEFSDAQYRFMLGLEGPRYDVIYRGLIRHIVDVAQEVFTVFKFSTLEQFPLTDLKNVCYQIGLNFKPVFFVPVRVRLYDNRVWEGSGFKTPLYVIKFISRYNEMWIITSLLNRHYKHIQGRAQWAAAAATSLSPSPSPSTSSRPSSSHSNFYLHCDENKEERNSR